MLYLSPLALFLLCDKSYLVVSGGAHDDNDWTTQNLSWAKSIPEYPPFSAAFLDYTHEILASEKEKNNQSNIHPTLDLCRLEFSNYGDNCGMCGGDCKLLKRALENSGSLRPFLDDPDLIIVSPELAVKPGIRPSSSWWAQARSMMIALPLRPPGKFYLIRKYRAGMGFRCADQGRTNDNTYTNMTLEETIAYGRQLKAMKPLNCSAVVSPGSREGACDAFCRLLYRPDIIWTGYDLADHDVKDDTLADRILSVTLPAGARAFSGDAWARFRRKHRYERADERDHGSSQVTDGTEEAHDLLAWFRGNCHGGELRTSTARYDLAKAFSKSAGGSPRPDVELEWYKEPKDNSCPNIEGPIGNVHNDRQAKIAAKEWFGSKSGDYFSVMLRSTFGFVPHGFARWNLRFLELLSTGTIPVVIADGLRMPYEQLIPWEAILVRLSEAEVRDGNADSILAPLKAMEPQEIRRRGRLARRVYELYFSTAEARVNALLASVGVIISDGVNISSKVPQEYGECRTSKFRRDKCAELGLKSAPLRKNFFSLS